MIKVYKFDYCPAFEVKLKALYATRKSEMPTEETFQYPYRERENSMITPIPKCYKVTPSDVSNYCRDSGTLDVDSVVGAPENQLTFDSHLFLHSNCTIPRAKVVQKYTRVLKPEKADLCVIPKFEGVPSVLKSAIFLNKEVGRIYIIKPEFRWNNNKWTVTEPKACENLPLGTPFLQINPSLKGTRIEEQKCYGETIRTYSQENWEAFLNSKLVYYGYTIDLRSKNLWLADVMYKTIHNVIYEDTVLATLGDESNILNEENYSNIKSMLESTDETVVGLGLKALAEMDYEKYRNTAVHLLCTVNHNWRNTDMKNSSSVRYMLKFLDIWNYSREHYTETITQEDFDMLIKVVNSEFTQNINNIKENFTVRFPFANIDFNYTVNITPKLDSRSVFTKPTDEEIDTMESAVDDEFNN